MSRKSEDETTGMLKKEPENLASSILQKTTTRREFIKIVGLGALSTAALSFISCSPAAQAIVPVEREVYAANALGMVIGNPTRCVGCRRCELACTEYNEGKSQPSIARVNIRRNWAFGPEGPRVGFWRGNGRMGNHRIIQETCRQCAHPVPCQLACPNDAIEIAPNTNARVINSDKCTGCRICQRACPWGMTTFDEKLEKATKCHLCGGDPQCVKACPSGALQYVPWEDRTKDIPARFVVPAYVQTPANVADTCVQCH